MQNTTPIPRYLTEDIHLYASRGISPSSAQHSSSFHHRHAQTSIIGPCPHSLTIPPIQLVLHERLLYRLVGPSSHARFACLTAWLLRSVLFSLGGPAKCRGASLPFENLRCLGRVQRAETGNELVVPSSSWGVSLKRRVWDNKDLNPRRILDRDNGDAAVWAGCIREGSTNMLCSFFCVISCLQYPWNTSSG
jgi:hypothetical protein